MNYTFSPDGQNLAWLDAHGLTRLQAGKRAKTDKRPYGGCVAHLSRSASGERLMVHNGKKYPWQAYLYDFPGIGKPTLIDHRSAEGRHTLHPDGQRYLTTSLDRHKPLRHLTAHTLDDGSNSHTHELTERATSALSRGTFQVAGHTLDVLVDRKAFSIHPDGTFLFLDRQHSWLAAGRMPSSDAPPAVTWTATVETRISDAITLHPAEDVSLVVSFDPAQSTNHVLAFPASGDPVAFTVSGIGPLQRDGDRLALQRDAHTVVTLSLAEAMAGDPAEVAHTIPGKAWHLDGRTLTPHDHDLFRREQISEPLWDVGVGDVLLHQTALWFVPWHGEAFLNLQTGHRVSRKLPGKPDQVSARRYMVARYDRYRELGLKVGVPLGLSHLRFKKGARQYFEFSVFDVPASTNLLARLISGLVGEISDDDNLNNLHGWGWSSGGNIYWVGRWKPMSAADVEEMLRFAAAHDVHPRTVLQLLMSYTNNLNVNPGNAPGETSLQAEQIMLWAAIEGYRRPDAVDILAELERWKRTPITEAFIDDHIDEVRAGCKHSGHLRGFEDVLKHHFSRQGIDLVLDLG